MIRINLLPVKAAKKRATGQRQLILMGVVVVVVGLAVTIFHLADASELTTMQQDNKEIKDAVAKLKGVVGNYDEVRNQKEKLVRQRDTIKRLQDSRGGPVFVLRELSEILTKDRGPTFDKDHYEELLRRDPNAGYNPSWDPRRVWVSSIRFAGGRLDLSAAAKANDDVAEFMKRLELSVFFRDVSLTGTSARGGGAGRHYGFGIGTNVNF